MQRLIWLVIPLVVRIPRRLNVGIKHQSEFLWLVGCKYGCALEPLKTIWLSFLTAFTWTCATRHAVRKTFEGMKAPIYELELKTTFPDSWKTTSQWGRYLWTWIILYNLYCWISDNLTMKNLVIWRDATRNLVIVSVHFIHLAIMSTGMNLKLTVSKLVCFENWPLYF